MRASLAGPLARDRHAPRVVASACHRMHAARPPMAMALGPPSGHCRKLYSCGCVRRIYSIERAANLHARRFANSVCNAEILSEMLFAGTLYTADSVCTALHCGANSVCNQHFKQCFSIANTVCKHSQFQGRHFGKCKAAKAIAQQCKAAQTCKHCDAVKGHLQRAKLRALHHSASLL